MTSEYEKLIGQVHEINDLGKAFALMSWDREVNMPQGGMADRIAQMTTLSSLVHRMSTTDEFGEAIERAAAELDGADYAGNEASLVRLLRRDYANARKLPTEFVARSTAVSAHFSPSASSGIPASARGCEWYGYSWLHVVVGSA